MAHFNYAKANKLKVKASKRINKLLSAGNGDSKPKRSGNTLKKSDKKSDEDFDSNKFDGPKKQCGKCGKWGNHTAEECTATDKDDKSSNSEEANFTTSGKSKSPARVVQKINFLDNNNSDEEEDSMHYHRNNRIKASNITREDFAFFTSVNSERVHGSELRWEFEGDSGHTHDEDMEDWVSQTTVNYVALMAQRRGQIKDTSRTSDDDDSTASDVESEDELAERDGHGNQFGTTSGEERRE